MKISRTLKQIMKQEGKKSLTSRKISNLKSSKEFNYLIDLSKV